jgi:hypothetical protein
MSSLVWLPIYLWGGRPRFPSILTADPYPGQLGGALCVFSFSLVRFVEDTHANSPYNLCFWVRASLCLRMTPTRFDHLVAEFLGYIPCNCIGGFLCDSRADAHPVSTTFLLSFYATFLCLCVGQVMPR